ncbi:hypothetical protein K439DRAFT_317307 [Ramaria rubella]|nr:hypothetical protein K439DRAFT_317307 [Ramaria rubella]
MDGKWDHASPVLKTLVAEFEDILRKIEKTAIKYTKSKMARLGFAFNAGAHETEINILEKILNDAQGRFLLLLALDTSATLTRYDATTHAIHSCVHERDHQVSSSRGDPNVEHHDSDFLTLGRKDFRLLREISTRTLYFSYCHRNAVTVRFQEAELLGNRGGLPVIVKTYEGKDPEASSIMTLQAVSHMYTDLRGSMTVLCSSHRMFLVANESWIPLCYNCLQPALRTPVFHFKCTMLQVTILRCLIFGSHACWTPTL